MLLRRCTRLRYLELVFVWGGNGGGKAPDGKEKGGKGRKREGKGGKRQEELVHELNPMR
jgi:hypothetical protein